MASIIDAIHDNPDDLVALALMKKSKAGDRYALTGANKGIGPKGVEEGAVEVGEHFHPDKNIPYEEYVDGSDPLKQGTAILDPKAEDAVDRVRLNNAAQKGVLALGLYRPGTTVHTVQDLYHINPAMHKMGWLSDIDGMYGSQPRNVWHKEMMRLAKEDPDIADILKGKDPEILKIVQESPLGSRWDRLMELLAKAEYGVGDAAEAAFTSDRPAYALPSGVVSYEGDKGMLSHFADKDDPEAALDDYLMDNFVDAIYNEALEASKDKDFDDTYLVHLGTKLPNIWNAQDYADNRTGMSVPDSKHITMREFDLSKVGPPATFLLSKGEQSPIVYYFKLRKSGAGGKDAFHTAFGVDPTKIPSDADIKEFSSGIKQGIEPLLKRKNIVDSIMTRF